jgi:hypothetical protein
VWTGLIWLRTGTGFCEHGNGHLIFIKCGGLLVQVCAYCAVVGVRCVMWKRHHLCPSIFSARAEKKALLVPDGVVENFCKVWVLAWDVR